MVNRVSLAFLIVGFGLFITGAALIYHPAGFLVAGGGMIAAALRRQQSGSKN